MEVRAVIFDCDGVLLDSEFLVAGTYVEVCRRFGLDVSHADLRAAIGLQQDKILRRFTEKTGLSDIPAGLDVALTSEINAKLEADSEPTDGVRAVLTALRAPFAVASSSSPSRLRLSLGRAGLLPLVEGRVFSATMVARGKPAPDLFLLAAREMGVAAARAIVIEDSVAGVEAARTAGMRAVGFAGGGHAGPDLGRRRPRHSSYARPARRDRRIAI